MTASRLVIAFTVLGAIPVHTQEPGASPADSTHAVYGTTTYGGAYNKGVLYKVDQAGNETVLYSFKGVPDGAFPTCSLTSDSVGNLYGTTSLGGKHDRGTVFKLDPSGNETVLHNFGGMTDGAYPFDGVRDAGGNLYGNTHSGGTHLQGVVFKINPIGNETILYSFSGGSDGGLPETRLIRDSLGNLYGTAGVGGLHNAGVVYKVDPAGNETVRYAFTGGTDGGYPRGAVTRDSAGNLYGTTSNAGKYGYGVVYKVDPSGNETVLYTFRGAGDGGSPWGVVRDVSGNLYGTTLGGGIHVGGHGYGVVYQVDASGNETVLHRFGAGGTGKDGAYPQRDLVRDSAGNLYGTTYSSRDPNRGIKVIGVVFKIGLAGQEHVLHAFSGPDGSNPSAGVIVR